MQSTLNPILQFPAESLTTVSLIQIPENLSVLICLACSLYAQFRIQHHLLLRTRHYLPPLQQHPITDHWTRIARHIRVLILLVGFEGVAGGESQASVGREVALGGVED